WDELGPGRLVAFDDLGWVRGLTPDGPRAFTAGKTIGIPEPVGARVRFEPPDASLPAATLIWEAEGEPARRARRLEDAHAEAVGFDDGPVRLAGTRFVPATRRRHPALALVH